MPFLLLFTTYLQKRDCAISSAVRNVTSPMEIQQNAFTFEDKLKQETFNEVQPKKNQPSETELCETVLLLKQIMPHRSLERAITMLYETLVKQKSAQEVYQTHGIEPVPPQPKKSNQQEVTKTYLKNDTNKRREDFGSENEWNRYKDLRAVAKSFVGKGYGYQHVIQELNKSNMEVSDKNKFSYNREVYKQAIAKVVTQAFRKLESFLSEDCKKRITPINKAEMKRLMTPLLSSSAFAEHIVTFKKYLRFNYGLSNVTFSEGESVKLYLQAMRFLNGRPISMEELESRCTRNQEKVDQEDSNSQNHEDNKEVNNWAQLPIGQKTPDKPIVKVEDALHEEGLLNKGFGQNEETQIKEEQQDLDFNFEGDL